MSWPDIFFSEEDKTNFREMALELEELMARDCKNYEDLERFSQYPPLVEALRLAKERKIDKPFNVPNTNYWFFETNLQDWTRTTGAGVLAKFLLAIEGFPYKETDAENQLTPDEVTLHEEEASAPVVEQRPNQADHGWLYRWIFGGLKK